MLQTPDSRASSRSPFTVHYQQYPTGTNSPSPIYNCSNYADLGSRYINFFQEVTEETYSTFERDILDIIHARHAEMRAQACALREAFEKERGKIQAMMLSIPRDHAGYQKAVQEHLEHLDKSTTLAMALQSRSERLFEATSAKMTAQVDEFKKEARALVDKYGVRYQRLEQKFKAMDQDKESTETVMRNMVKLMKR